MLMHSTLYEVGATFESAHYLFKCILISFKWGQSVSALIVNVSSFFCVLDKFIVKLLHISTILIIIIFFFFSVLLR